MTTEQRARERVARRIAERIDKTTLGPIMDLLDEQAMLAREIDRKLNAIVDRIRSGTDYERI